MRITESQLRRIIRQESQALSEAAHISRDPRLNSAAVGALRDFLEDLSDPEYIIEDLAVTYGERAVDVVAIIRDAAAALEDGLKAFGPGQLSAARGRM